MSELKQEHEEVRQYYGKLIEDFEGIFFTEDSKKNQQNFSAEPNNANKLQT